MNLLVRRSVFKYQSLKLDKVELRENNGLNRPQIKRAMQIVTQNIELLIEKWREIYA